MEIIKKGWKLNDKIWRSFDTYSILEKDITLKFIETKIYLNLDSLHATLNNHYKAWSCKKKKNKKIKV